MWHPDPDQLVLAALPAEPSDPRVEQHLAGCSLCRQYVGSLRHTVDLAVAGRGDGPDDAERPPDRVWRAITEELDIGSAATGPPAAGHGRFGTRRWRRLAVPVAAAVLGVGAGLGVAAGLGIGAGLGTSATPTAPPSTAVIARLAPVGPLDPTGTGSVEVAERGGERAMVVRLDGVTDLAGGDYLEAWLMDRAGARLVSLGALAPDGRGYRGEFTVPADLPMAEFDLVDVSAERWDGDETHSTVSLLRGELA